MLSLGVSKVGGGLPRRIDILVVPAGSHAATLLYMTGSAYFNRSLRLYDLLSLSFTFSNLLSQEVKEEWILSMQPRCSKVESVSGGVKSELTKY